jgi:hydrogenase nickel incorporation protein HypB
MIEAILPKVTFSEKGILFIENIGNLVCPAEFVIGEQMKILICSVPEGSDKPYKYPAAFQRASAVILNKMDLLPHIPFDLDYFEKGVRLLNPEIQLFPVSCATSEGFAPLVTWIRDCAMPILDVSH